MQSSGDTFVKFQAGDFDSLTGSDLVDNGDGTLTTDSKTGNGNGVVTFSIDFETTGDYYLYFHNTNTGGSSDSIFLTQGTFDASPGTGTDANRWNNLDDGDDWDLFVIDGEYAGNSITNTAIEWNVASAGNKTVTFNSREAGLVWRDFVFSTSDSLTTTDLNNLSYSAVPEPASFALLAGTLGLALVMIRRRGSRA